RQHYWPRGAAAGAGDLTAAGLGSTGHPLLGAAVELAAGDAVLLTGRLSAAALPWLADHAVAGVVLVPGTAFVEIAAVAAHRAGCGRIEELTIEAPLALPAQAGIQVQATVAAADAAGRRELHVHARTGDDAPWTRHASGLLSPAGPAPLDRAGEFLAWPPPGAEPVDVAGLYSRLDANGYGYGPAFRGLTAAWRRGGDVFADIALPEPAATTAGAYGIHPALLDAALHPAVLAGRDDADHDDRTGAGRDGAGRGPQLPFSWSGISLHQPGARSLRVRLSRDATGALTLDAADAAGTPVVSAARLVLRPVSAAALTAAQGSVADALFTVEWVPATDAPDTVLPATLAAVASGGQFAGAGLPVYPDLGALAAAVAAGEPAPDAVLACAVAAPEAAGDRAADDPAADGTHAGATARRVTSQVLALLKEWLSLPAADAARLASTRLVIVTSGAVAVTADEAVADLPGAAALGLARSAQAENPGRIILADLPVLAGDDPADRAAALTVLAAALAGPEPEIALRGPQVYARRITRPAPAPGSTAPERT
ncbi:MAG TPA: polyketide synthase dehydratase domain-containing protein, partial [Trebonia sp.]